MKNQEVNIFQEELDRFLSVAQGLKLDGLLGKHYDEEHKVHQIFQPLKEQTPPNVKHEKYGDKNCGNFNKTENDAIQFAMSSEEKNNLVATVDQHVERIDNGSWICKICGKSANTRQHMQYHVEAKHLEGLSLPCITYVKKYSGQELISYS